MWTPIEENIITAEQKAALGQTTLISAFQNAIQSHVDQIAVARKYNDGNAIAGYVNSTVTAWATEATVFVAWRDSVWVYAYAELDKVIAATRTTPTIEEFIAELPVISWPE